jgi:hypothetical protein
MQIYAITIMAMHLVTKFLFLHKTQKHYRNDPVEQTHSNQTLTIQRAHNYGHPSEYMPS